MSKCTAVFTFGIDEFLTGVELRGGQLLLHLPNVLWVNVVQQTLSNQLRLRDSTSESHTISCISCLL